MPRYLYECQSCGKLTEVFHSITIKYKECGELDGPCTEDAKLTRIPSFSGALKYRKDDKKQPAGRVTDNFIEDARTELKEQKENMKRREYDD